MQMHLPSSQPDPPKYVECSIVAPSELNTVINASPLSLYVLSNAGEETGKSLEFVSPVIIALSYIFIAREMQYAGSTPPTNVEYRRVLPSALNLLMKPSQIGRA